MSQTLNKIVVNEQETNFDILTYPDISKTTSSLNTSASEIVAKQDDLSNKDGFSLSKEDLFAGLITPLSSYEIGDVVSLAFQQNLNVRSIQIKVTEGDIFILRSAGGSDRAYALLDDSRHLLEASSINAVFCGYIKITQKGYLVVNHTGTGNFRFAKFNSNLNNPIVIKGYSFALSTLNEGDTLSQTLYENDGMFTTIVKVSDYVFDYIRVAGGPTNNPRLLGVFDASLQTISISQSMAGLAETYISIDVKYLIIQSYEIPIVITHPKHKSILSVTDYSMTQRHTLETAIQAVPARARQQFCLLKFRDSDGEVHIYKYRFPDISDAYWLASSSWSELGRSGDAIEEQNIGIGERGYYLDKNDYQVKYESQLPYKITNYYSISGIEYIASAMGSSASAIVYYDSNKNPLGALNETATGHNTKRYLSDLTIPQGTAYIRATVNVSEEEDPSIVGYSLQGVISSLQGVISSLQEEIDKCIQDPQTLKPFIIADTYIDRNSGEEIKDSSLPYSATPFITLAGVSSVLSSQGTYASAITFYDKDFKYISSLSDQATGSPTLRNISDLTIPEGAVYIRCSCQPESGRITMTFNSALNTAMLTPPKAKTVQDVNWLALGDSITQGYYSDNISPGYHLDPSKGWTHIMQNLTGYNLINKAIGGTGYVCTGPRHESTPGVQLVDQLAQQGVLSDIDLITVAYGVNDWKYNYHIGSMDDPVNNQATAIIPGMRYVLEKLLLESPNSKIVVITPFNCAFGSKANNWGLGYPYSNNGTLQFVFEKMVEICDYYSIEYIDMTHYSCINRENIQQLLLDTVHPSIPAHVLLGHELSKKVNF